MTFNASTQEAWRKDPDLQQAPAALLRAAQTAKRLAERTGTPYIVREKPDDIEAMRTPAGLASGCGGLAERHTG